MGGIILITAVGKGCVVLRSCYISNSTRIFLLRPVQYKLHQHGTLLCQKGVSEVFNQAANLTYFSSGLQIFILVNLDGHVFGQHDESGVKVLNALDGLRRPLLLLMVHERPGFRSNDLQTQYLDGHVAAQHDESAVKLLNALYDIRRSLPLHVDFSGHISS